MNRINRMIHMKQNDVVDDLAAIEQLRQDEQNEKSQIYDPDAVCPQKAEAVDYLAISKAWEKERNGRYIIHLQTGKKNPSHDPICRGKEYESAF